MRDGTQVDISGSNANVFAFLRQSGDATVVVALNMSGKAQTIKLDWASHGVHGTVLKQLYASAPIVTDKYDVVTLEPFGALVARVE